jgi:hypothetical protein
MYNYALAGLMVAGMSLPAAADMKVSSEERTKAFAVAKTQGCKGGTIEKDRDGRILYEIENTVCANGIRYDLLLDKNFKLLAKHVD